MEEHAIPWGVDAFQQQEFGERQQRDGEDQARPVEAPAEQHGSRGDRKGEDRGEAGRGAVQRRHGHQQRGRDENRDFGDQLGEDAFHRASNGTFSGRLELGVRSLGTPTPDSQFLTPFLSG